MHKKKNKQNIEQLKKQNIGVNFHKTDGAIFIKTFLNKTGDFIK